MRELHFYVAQRFDQMRETNQPGFKDRMDELNLLFSHFLKGLASDQAKVQLELRELMLKVQKDLDAIQ